MSDDIDKVLADQVASGKITTEDAVRVHIFNQFLAETPKGVAQALRVGTEAVLACFPDRDSFLAWRTRWLPYALGMADGPTEPDEYAQLFPKDAG
jgi:hypothetical protein